MSDELKPCPHCGNNDYVTVGRVEGETDAAKCDMRDFGADTQEWLEADARQFAWDYLFGEEYEKLDAELMRLLDRQAAITKRECMTAAGLVATESPALQAKVDSLTAECDELRDESLHLQEALRQKQRVVDIQRDSFFGIERRCAELAKLALAMWRAMEICKLKGKAPDSAALESWAERLAECEIEAM